ncbi:MAG: hypothetical protein J6K32_05195 [Clostridia bacterium]|nr:hypothetical protein [Clostridia bacterium]
MNQENQTFQYTYSAKEQEEIRRIRSRYMPKAENRMEQLRRLDAQAAQRAAMMAIIVGVVGALVLGLGMSCCMVWGGALFAPGIVIGVIGMAITAAAYPLYERTLKKERERIAPEIIRLTDELMK